MSKVIRAQDFDFELGDAISIPSVHTFEGYQLLMKAGLIKNIIGVRSPSGDIGWRSADTVRGARSFIDTYRLTSLSEFMDRVNAELHDNLSHYMDQGSASIRGTDIPIDKVISFVDTVDQAGSGRDSSQLGEYVAEYFV